MRRFSVKFCSQAFTIVLHVFLSVEWKEGHAELRRAKLCWAKACGGRGGIQGGKVGADNPHPKHHCVKEKLTAINLFNISVNHLFIWLH